MIATNNLNCTIKKKLLILLTLFSLNSCEELEESLADNSVSTGDSCHVSWVGKYKGPNDLTDHFEGKTVLMGYK